MTGRGVWIGVLIAAALLTAACNVPPPVSNGGGGGDGGSPELDVVQEGHTFVGGKVVVTDVDGTRLGKGRASVTLKNRTGEFLPDLAYEFTLYRPNREAGAVGASIPFTSFTYHKQRIDLEAGGTVTLSAPGAGDERLFTGATDVQFRMRQEPPRPTVVHDMFLSGRVEVVDVQRSWYVTPPRAGFRVRNVWDGPVRMNYRILLIEDGKVVGETPWKTAPGALGPGEETLLEAELQGFRGKAGVYPALKIRRPNI